MVVLAVNCSKVKFTNEQDLYLSITQGVFPGAVKFETIRKDLHGFENSPDEMISDCLNMQYTTMHTLFDLVTC